MNEDEKDDIADRTCERLLKALRTEKKAFWVQPEKHYNHHNRLEGWFDAFDWGSKLIGRAIITMILAGIIIIIAIGTKIIKF